MWVCVHACYYYMCSCSYNEHIPDKCAWVWICVLFIHTSSFFCCCFSRAPAHIPCVKKLTNKHMHMHTETSARHHCMAARSISAWKGNISSSCWRTYTNWNVELDDGSSQSNISVWIHNFWPPNGRNRTIEELAPHQNEWQSEFYTIVRIGSAIQHSIAMEAAATMAHCMACSALKDISSMDKCKYFYYHYHCLVWWLLNETRQFKNKYNNNCQWNKY